MDALIGVILPVFLVIGTGYALTRSGFFSEALIDGLMRFSQGFAIPCLLFLAIANLDLKAGFNPALLISFYSGAILGFTSGVVGARLLFGRDWEDSIAIGFLCLFSNSVLLGLPITERAYGAAALSGNFAIVALHAPTCYGIGVTAMEIIRNRGESPLRMARAVAVAMFRNALILAIVLGFAVNLLQITLPVAVEDALNMVARGALPCALVALGGVLVQYRPDGDLRTILYVCAVSLVLHPLITLSLGKTLALSPDHLRSAVLTGAMAPGVNGYIFASLYGRAQRVAASSVLVATAASVVTIWVWLAILG